MVHQLQVDREHGVALGHVHLLPEDLRDVQAGLCPHHIEVATKLYAVLLKKFNFSIFVFLPKCVKSL